MALWNVPAKLAYALSVVGDARLGEDARPALNRVLESLSSGPPPAVELRAWITESGRMGMLPVAQLMAQFPPEALRDVVGEPSVSRRFSEAVSGMLLAPAEGAAIDPRAPWGLLVLAATMASVSNGVVYDSGTQRVVPSWILENPLDGFLLGSIKNHVVILSSSDAAGLQTTTTLGLNKYGLFELQLGGVPASAGNIGVLMAGLAQAVVDARPAAPGPWDVPSSFDVTRLHVAHAFGTEIETSGGKGRFEIAPAADGDLYWNVTAEHGTLLDEESIAEALRALDFGAANESAV